MVFAGGRVQTGSVYTLFQLVQVGRWSAGSVPSAPVAKRP